MAYGAFYACLTTYFQGCLYTGPAGPPIDRIQGTVPWQLQEKVDHIACCQCLNPRAAKAYGFIHRLEGQRVDLNVARPECAAVKDGLDVFEPLCQVGSVRSKPRVRANSNVGKMKEK